MLNRVVLVGRWTKEPELTYTPNTGTAVMTCTLAVNRIGKNNEADFIPIVAWKGTAENTSQYTKKGSIVAVDGRIQTRSYDHTDGTKRFVTEVVAETIKFLDSKPKSDSEYSQFGQEVDEDAPF